MEIKPLQDEPYDADKRPELVNSQERKLNIGEITVIASHYSGSKQPPNVVALSILQELGDGGGEHIQIGNTLFIFHRAENPKNIFFRALNADVAENYVQNSIEFIQWAYQQGVDLGVTEFEGELILKMIKMVSREMEQIGYEGGGYKAWRLQNGTYRVVVQFGPPRG